MVIKILKQVWAALWRYWFRLPRPLRFLLVGGFNTVAGYGVFLLFVWLLGAGRYQICLALQYIFFSFVAYTTQKIFVFADRTTHLKTITHQYISAATTWFVGYIINAALLHLLVDELAINLYLSQFLAMMVVALSNYYGLKTFAFKMKKI
ncbi:MAG: GtrA family protein [Hydrotalea sp.]|nr:GtrA family protein [Hydrotalea sp.]